MAQTIDRGVRQTRRYWYEDGLVELLFGFGGVVTGGLVLADLSTLVPWLMIFGLLGAKQVIRLIRTRVTHPRTGYVAYREPSRLRATLGAVAAFVVAASIAWAAVRLPDVRSGYAAIQGILVAGVLLWAGSRTGIDRLSVLAAASAVLGLAATVAIGGLAGWGLYVITMGIAFVLSGGLTLRAYLHDAPPSSIA